MRSRRWTLALLLAQGSNGRSRSPLRTADIAGGSGRPSVHVASIGRGLRRQRCLRSVGTTEIPASWNATAASAGHPESRTTIMRLLIVDDNAHFLEAARDLLEREGMTVVAVASTSAEALRPRRRAPARRHPRRRRSRRRQRFRPGARSSPPRAVGLRSPVILISATPEQDLVELIDDSPAIGFVSKSDLSGRAIVGLLARAQNGCR